MMIRRAFLASVTPVNDRQLRAVLATEELGRDNLIIRLAGVQTPESITGLFNHDPALPVCRWSELDGVRYGSPALATFPPVGTSDRADEVCRLAKQGTIDSVSIGFEPLAVEPADQKNYPRGAKIVTRCELLECSWVSVPADRGAKVVERIYRRSLRDRLDELREHVGDAQEHHADLERAMRRSDKSAAMRSHRELGRCLDRAEQCLRGFANEGAELDIENTSKAQTSGGLTYGSSDGGRSALSYWERQAELLRLSGQLSATAPPSASPACARRNSCRHGSMARRARSPAASAGH